MATADTSSRPDFRSMLTVYGRKAVLEALLDESLPVYRLHLANSNRDGATLRQIEAAAAARQIDINRIDRHQLARISRNGKQDQGVAADLQLAHFSGLDTFLADYRPADSDRFLLLDGVTNPQNVGMIIRSAAAAGIRGVIVPDRGCASLGPLVIKASAGALFRCPILRCETASDAVPALRKAGIDLYTLEAGATQSLVDNRYSNASAFVLGNETSGVDDELRKAAAGSLAIPMHNGVESLNVAVTAALVCYLAR